MEAYQYKQMTAIKNKKSELNYFDLSRSYMMSSNRHIKNEGQSGSQHVFKLCHAFGFFLLLQ